MVQPILGFRNSNLLSMFRSSYWFLRDSQSWTELVIWTLLFKLTFILKLPICNLHYSCTLSELMNKFIFLILTYLPTLLLHSSKSIIVLQTNWAGSLDSLKKMATQSLILLWSLNECFVDTFVKPCCFSKERLMM